MRYPVTQLAASVALVFAGVLATGTTVAEEKKEMSPVEQGKEIAFDRKKGNCLSCHMIEGGQLTGNIAPPLMAMSTRFPDKAKLRAQIWDSTVANPNTIMPPFGKYHILSDKEVDLVAEFIYSL